MKKSEVYNSVTDMDNRRLLDSNDLIIYVGMSRKLARRFCDSIGATRKYSTRVMYDKCVIDEYLNNQQQAQIVI